MTTGPGQDLAADVPGRLISSVVDLVDTGPVLLGAYTAAELTAVDAIVDFLEARPADEVLAEAVRSLAARQLLVPGLDAGQVQVRGDLGIAVAFQQRARTVLDARVTGTSPGEPWRILVLPQPEQIAMVIRIDALGVHEIRLIRLRYALDHLAEWLPGGEPARQAEPDDADSVLADAERSALVTVTRYTSHGSAETVTGTTDLVLVRRDGRLHAFSRDAGDPARLVSRSLDGESVREVVARQLERGPGAFA